MTSFERHERDLDGTRAKWRPTLVPTLRDGAGDPIAWAERAVVSCPACGACFGVGGKGSTPIETATGKAKGKCWNCPWADDVTLEGYANAPAREAFGRIKADAEEDVQRQKDAKLAADVAREHAAELAGRIDAAIKARRQSVRNERG